jgi:subtilisin family serine protease
LPRRIVILAALAASLATASRAAAFEPSDALQGEQWAVAPGAIFNLPGAWQLSQGAGVVVAVVDSGMRLDHPDLAPNVWTNFGEIPGNGVDDDHNGYVDDVHGIDLTSNSRGQNLSDGFGHGTHVSGTIAAAANGRGVVGVAFKAKLMVVRVLGDDGGGSTGAVAEGIRYAAANGARVINLSLETNVNDPRMTSAVEAAGAANALVVASAGNSGIDVDNHPTFPAAIPAPNVVAVAATGPTAGRSLADFSNYGRLTIPVAAPGVDVISTSRTGGYEYKSGTSMAAPHVAGVAALMAGVAPQLTAAELRGILLQHASRSGLPIGAGYVDALGAVAASAGASSLQQGQPPQVRVLAATRKGRSIRAQIALLGATTAISRVRITLDGRRVTELSGGRSPVTVQVRGRSGRKLGAIALAANGSRLAAASLRVRKVNAGKGGVRQGGGIGTSGRVWAG